VGEVSVSADLKVATIYVMPLFGKGSVEEAIAALARHKGIIRKKVSEEVILRHAPDLRFRADETYDRMDETRRLFSDPVVQRDIAARDEASGDEPPEDQAGA
jgi:ribosome-binding factor A